jgi:hypothetical protein
MGKCRHAGTSIGKTSGRARNVASDQLGGGNGKGFAFAARQPHEH